MRLMSWITWRSRPSRRRHRQQLFVLRLVRVLPQPGRDEHEVVVHFIPQEDLAELHDEGAGVEVGQNSHFLVIPNQRRIWAKKPEGRQLWQRPFVTLSSSAKPRVMVAQSLDHTVTYFCRSHTSLVGGYSVIAGFPDDVILPESYFPAGPPKSSSTSDLLIPVLILPKVAA